MEESKIEIPSKEESSAPSEARLSEAPSMSRPLPARESASGQDVRRPGVCDPNNPGCR